MTEQELATKSKKFGAAGYVKPGGKGVVKFPKAAKPLPARPSMPPQASPKNQAIKRALANFSKPPSVSRAPGTPGGADPSQVLRGNQNPMRPGNVAGNDLTKFKNTVGGISNLINSEAPKPSPTPIPKMKPELMKKLKPRMK